MHFAQTHTQTVPKMTTLAIAIVTGKGGKEFLREAEAFCDHRSQLGETVELVTLKKAPQWKLRQDVLTSILNCQHKIDKLAFFCHGRPKWLRCGFHVWNVDLLADFIAQRCGRRLDIALYACSTGRELRSYPWRLTSKEWKRSALPGKAGFAARLTGALLDRGVDVEVFAHSSKGHTTRNPYCYRFCGDLARVYRVPIVQRGGVEWKAWKTALKTEKRFDVPFE